MSAPSRLEDLVRERAAGDGRAAAVVMGTERLSYTELDDASDRIAQVLQLHGCRPGDRVAVLAARAPATIAALLGVLKAGAAYVPIDPASPVKRTAAVIRDTEPAALIVNRAADAAMSALLTQAADALVAGTAILGLDGVPPDGPGGPGGPRLGPDELAAAGRPAPLARADPDAAAHILFTSGSTGRPKGVIVRHRSVLAFVSWAVSHFGIRAADRLSGHPPLHFDLSTFDIYGSIRAGAELHLVPPSIVLPRQLAAYVVDARLTQLFCVPSALTWLRNHGALPGDGFPSLKRVIWCGEVLAPAVLADWMRRVPQARFTNLYGPTETTIASSHHTVSRPPPDGAAPIPIGTACAGEELIVLDADGRPAAVDEAGELAIAGVGLSPGYWRDPEATAAAFGPDPRADRPGERIYRTGDLARRDAAGIHHFLGRRDTQIKSRGYRIELGEIETATSALPQIAECAVLGVPTDGFEGTAICCAYAARGDIVAEPAVLASGLRETLPAYMIPSRWHALDVLPKNVNGKIDRVALGELFRGGSC